MQLCFNLVMTTEEDTCQSGDGQRCRIIDITHQTSLFSSSLMSCDSAVIHMLDLRSEYSQKARVFLLLLIFIIIIIIIIFVSFWKRKGIFKTALKDFP